MNNLSTPRTTIALSQAMPVLNELEQRGYKLEVLFADVSILAPNSATNPSDTLLSVAEFSRLYSHACRLLEAEVSGRQDNSSISKDAQDMLCYCVITCRTLRDVIKRAATYCRVAGPVEGDVLYLHEKGELATLVIDVPHRANDIASLLVCLSAINHLHQLFSWLTGKPLHLEKITLEYPDPQALVALGSLVSQPLCWGAQSNAMVFRVDELARPVLRSVSDLEEVIDYFPFDVQLYNHYLLTLSERLRVLLKAALERDLPPMGSSTAAQMLHMSAATFRRNLRKENSSFTTILKECQRARALYLVQNTQVPLTDIATRIGYSDDRAFRRAFRSWTGLSPSECRNRTQPETAMANDR